MTADTLEAAVAALDAGLCPIPARIDGTKVPQGKWKKWQSTRPDRSDVESWFGTGHAGLGIVCGQVSDGLEMFEFEGRAIADGLLDEWKAAVHNAGIYDLWAHIVRGYAERTPSGGVHVLYKCEQVDGNLKLARRPATPAELDDNPADKIKVLIETRGEGGFTIVAPSNGTTHPTGKPWTLTHGGFDTIATISAEQRDALHAVARSFDQVDDEIPDRPEPSGEPGDGGTLPGFDLTAADVLEAAGYKYHSTGEGGAVHWTRPGKPVSEGHSVTVWATDGRATPYSSSIDAPAEFLTMKRRLSPWQLHVALNYAGDFTAAGRAWRAAHPRTPDTDTTWTGINPPANVDPETGEITTPAGAANASPASGGAMVLPNEFWTARPALGHIRQAAHSRMVSADAVLHVVLARLAAFAPHTLHLPPIRGGRRPLCWFVANVGPPETGKSGAIDVGTDLLPPPGEYVVDNLPVGSGEGLVEILFDIVPETDGSGNTKNVKRQKFHNAFVAIDEGQVLTDIGSRNGAVLLSTLRTIWSGGQLGQANATSERRRIVPAGSYTFGIVAGFQPGAAGGLIDDAPAGTPQRFIWAAAADPNIPREQVDWPGELDWKPPAGIEHGWPFDVDDTVAHEIWEHGYNVVSGAYTVPLLEAQGNLLRLKAAALLALLDGRTDVTVDDWELARVIQETSNRVRDGVVANVTYEAQRREQVARDRHAGRQVAADDAVETRRRIHDHAGKLADLVAEKPGQTRSELYRSRPRWRDVFDAALALALDKGWVTEHVQPGRGGNKHTFHPADEGAA